MEGIKADIKGMRQEMLLAQKKGDTVIFRARKIKLDKLLEIEHKIRSSGQEKKFAMRHTPEEIHNFIDLIGYYKNEALEITDRRIAETQKCLDRGEIHANMGNGRDHIYKVIAHKGKHSSKRGPVLKFAVKDYLERQGFDHHQDMDHGVFLIRLQVHK